MQDGIINKQKTIANLPAKRKEDFLALINTAKLNKLDAIIVLDDDPTGTQTVYDVPVLTNWTKEAIFKEFAKGTFLFYILTNSRSLLATEAEELTQTIGNNIQAAAVVNNTRYWVISRSDSTLRGHYPLEVDALAKGLNCKNYIQFLLPAFFEGGRLTINNNHYVQQGNDLIPAADTTYGKDKVFGYQSSDMTRWVEEKTAGKIKAKEVRTISIAALRSFSMEEMVETINKLSKGCVCVVNAADYQDLYFFAYALLQSKVHPIFRTAASFVSAINGMSQRPLLTNANFKSSKNGGLIIVGSYVPTSSSQLTYLLENSSDIFPIEMDVQQILQSDNLMPFINKIVKQIDQTLETGQTVVVYTSRKVQKGQSDKENQEMGKRISNCITTIINRLTIPPAYLISKGGITSSDIATKGLGIQRAIVIGQIIKGVPVWELGAETKFPGSHQVIFPGNVGTEKSLIEVVDKLEKG